MPAAAHDEPILKRFRAALDALYGARGAARDMIEMAIRLIERVSKTLA